MQPIKKQWPTWPTACMLLLALLGGCATPTPPVPDVGQVVVAPRAQLPPPPMLVQQTQPMPVGYFQCSFLTYSLGSCEKLTTSTPPTQAAGQMPTR